MNASRSGAGGLAQLTPVGLEEGSELADPREVAGHGASGEVLGPQVPLEGATGLAEALLSMVRTVAQ